MIKATLTGDKALQNRIKRVIEGLPVAVGAGIEHAGDRATQAMERRIETATTITGVVRSVMKGGHPGRILSMHLIRSLRGGDGTPGRSLGSTSNTVKQEFGYVNDPPRYAAAQEENLYSLSGVLNALQHAYSELTENVENDVSDEITSLMEKTAKGKYRAPKRAYRVWGG